MQKGIDFKQNPAILNDYLLYLLNTKNYSLGTIKGYELDLQLFFNFILEYKQINMTLIKITIFILFQIKTEDIYAYLVYLNHEKNNCSSTRQRKLAAIKSFFKWLYLNEPNSNKKNPAIVIPQIELHYRLPKYLTLDQAKQIQVIFNLKNSKYPIRNNAIITLFLSTGIRISELLSININDLDFENNCIRILGKGNKERIVYFSNYCKQQIKKYLDIRKDVKENALFLSSHNVRISKSSVENICKQAYSLLGLENKHYSAHTLRHTAATIFYEYSNNDILLLKEILGHSTIISTEIYTHIKNKAVKEAIEKNPLSNYNVKVA